MRTTLGKTKPHRPPARKIQIWKPGVSGYPPQLVAERNASSLSQALKEFAKQRYKVKNPIVVGNTWTFGDRLFVAKEAPNNATR